MQRDTSRGSERDDVLATSYTKVWLLTILLTLDRSSVELLHPRELREEALASQITSGW